MQPGFAVTIASTFVSGTSSIFRASSSGCVRDVSRAENFLKIVKEPRIQLVFARRERLRSLESRAAASVNERTTRTRAAAARTSAQWCILLGRKRRFREVLSEPTQGFGHAADVSGRPGHSRSAFRCGLLDAP